MFYACKKAANYEGGEVDVELIAITQPVTFWSIEQFVEHCGRVCYNSQPQGNPQKFIKGRIAVGHESIAEHANATFEISGISRACSHQLVRHRLASYSQESQRYVDAEESDVVAPKDILRNDEANDLFEWFAQKSLEVYAQLRDLGIKKEDARFVLPQAIKTRIIVTMNFRELRHFFKLRLDKVAQWEIREVAGKMLELVKRYAPSVFDDIKLD